MAAQTVVSKEQDPGNPANQVNPVWAQKLESSINRLAEQASSRPAAFEQKQPAQDRQNWTTPEEAQKYNSMVDKEYVKIDAKTKKPEKDGKFYRIIHWFPEFQTSNPDEFKSFFVVNQCEIFDAGDGVQRERIVTNFNIRAPEFCANYKPTVVGLESEPVQQEK